MSLEQHFEATEKPCPDCGSALARDRISTRHYCRDCDEAKVPVE